MTTTSVIKKPVDIGEILQYPPEENKWLYEGKVYKKKAPQSFKYKLNVEEVAQKLGFHIVNLLHQFTNVKRISISGMIEEEEIQINFDGYGSYKENQIRFRIEDKNYKRFTEKAKVSSPIHGNYEEAVKHLAKIRAFLNNLPAIPVQVQENFYKEEMLEFLKGGED